MDIRASKPHETLERVGLLRSLDAKDRVGFERRCQWRHARGKEWLLEQNDVGTDIFFLTSGVVRVLITPSPDREIILGDIEAGGYFGEMAAIDGQPRSAGILAITDATIAAMPAPVFREIIHNHPDVSEQLLQQLVARDAQCLGRRIEIKPMPGFVLNLCKENGLALKGRCTGDPVAFRQLANDFGMRMLTNLADQGLAVAFRHPVLRLDLFTVVDPLLESLLFGRHFLAGLQSVRFHKLCVHATSSNCAGLKSSAFRLGFPQCGRLLSKQPTLSRALKTNLHPLQNERDPLTNTDTHGAKRILLAGPL